MRDRRSRLLPDLTSGLVSLSRIKELSGQALSPSRISESDYRSRRPYRFHAPGGSRCTAAPRSRGVSAADWAHQHAITTVVQ